MPRGNPKRMTVLRLTHARVEAVRQHGVPLTQAVEEGIDLWLAREKRRKALAARAEAGSHPMPLPPDAPVLGGKR